MSITTYAVTGARMVRRATVLTAVSLLVAVLALQAFSARYGTLSAGDGPDGTSRELTVVTSQEN